METLKAVYLRHFNILKSFLFQFDIERFMNLVETTVARKRIKVQSTCFKKVFQSIIYSKIITEIDCGRSLELIESIKNNLIIGKNKTGLYMAIALIQLVEDGSGVRLEPRNLKLEENDVLFKSKMKDCCRLLSESLTEEENNNKDKFNEKYQTRLRLLDFLCLQVFSFYDSETLRKYMNINELWFSDDITFSDTPIEQLFVPTFDRHLIFKSASLYFSNIPNCLERYGNIQLAAFNQTIIIPLHSESMKREWVTTIFLNNNLKCLIQKYNNFLKEIIPNMLKTNLIIYNDILCVVFDNSDYRMSSIFDLEEVHELLYLNEPIYKFIACTLGPYLRILAKIDPSLELPSIKEPFTGIFYSYIHGNYNDSAKFLFNALTPIKNKNSIETEKSRVDNISLLINEFIMTRLWIDYSQYFKYTGEDLNDLFEKMILLVNDEKFINAQAKFISEILNIPLYYVKFSKSIKEIEIESQDAFNKRKVLL